MGGAADLGCGLGTLAIAAARLGWMPVIAVDRMEGAVAAAARERRAQRASTSTGASATSSPERCRSPSSCSSTPRRPSTRGVALRCSERRARPPDLVRARHVIVSGVVPTELDAVTRDYAAAGWTVADAREQDGWAAALLEPAGA